MATRQPDVGSLVFPRLIPRPDRCIYFKRSRQRGKAQDSSGIFLGVSRSEQHGKTKGSHGQGIFQPVPSRSGQARRLDVPAVNKLLDRMKNSSRPVSPRALGLVGEEHFKKQLQRLGVTPDSFKYTRICAVGPDQLPYCIEAAFGIKNDPKLPRTRIMGLNWSPSFGVPIPEIEEAIQTMRIDKHDPVVLVVHLSTPKLHFVSRGKARAEL